MPSDTANPADIFLGRLRRTLTQPERRVGPRLVVAEQFRVSAVHEPFINEKIGSFLVLSRAGQGAMSVVYKARQDVTDRVVAIKMMRTQLCCDPNNVKRFQREAKAISRLSHPNLLNVYDVGTAQTGQPYIVMDFIEGNSLSEMVEKYGAMPWQKAIDVFQKVCDAMQHAHSHNIIHRDLKPDNIMFMRGQDGHDSVKVVDFGIVKFTDESQAMSQRLTQAGEVWGSPVYMSPEQCSGKPLDARSDIYSLGTVMYECLVGQPVFVAKRITEIIMKQLNQNPDSFAKVRPDLQIPEWLESVVFKAIEKEPEKRFQTMAEMANALRATRSATASNAVPSAPMATADSGNIAKLTAEPAASDEPEQVSTAKIVFEDPVQRFLNKRLGGRFLIQSVLGQGGMSVVYLALQEGIGRQVAIKFLRLELCQDESYVKRFQREAKAVSKLTHPNLVSIFDFGIADTGQPYLVMELAEGKSLSDILDREKKLPLNRALPIFMQICDVMKYAHDQGVIHRDLKPQNVMLIQSGTQKAFVKVVDFGMLKLDENMLAISQRLTASGEICGSPLYMSPEQALDESVDSRTDIYSLGILMYETLTGVPPFTGTKITEVINKHISDPVPPMLEQFPDIGISPMMVSIIQRTLEKKPADRYASMAELKEALQVAYSRMPTVITQKPTAESQSGTVVLSADKFVGTISGGTSSNPLKLPIILCIAFVVAATAAFFGAKALLDNHAQKDAPTQQAAPAVTPLVQQQNQAAVQEPRATKLPAATAEPQAAETAPERATHSVAPITDESKPVAKAAKPVHSTHTKRGHRDSALLQELEEIEHAVAGKSGRIRKDAFDALRR